LYEQELAKNKLKMLQNVLLMKFCDRSAKIRTYNYAQGRVTDHRVGLTLYDLGNIMNGDIQKIVDELALVNNMEN
jgi:peptide chain release factor 1